MHEPSEALAPVSREPLHVGHRLSLGALAADVEAAGPSLDIVFDESAMALAELIAGTDAGAPAQSWLRVDLRAPDLPSLAREWVNRLLADAAGHDAALVDVAVDDVAAPDDAHPDGWRVQARAGFRKTFGRGARAIQVDPVAPDVRVESTGGTYRLLAHLATTSRWVLPVGTGPVAPRHFGA
jgi:hypothetical protein